jgi:hypothetical protein
MAHDAEAAAQLEPAGVAHRPVLWAALASVALMLGAIWGLKAVYERWVPNRTLPAPEQFPSPRVQAHQAEQLQDLLAAQRQQLMGYAWADAGQALVRIPIERAMDLIAQRGAEAYAPIPPQGHAPPAPAAEKEPATTGQGQPGGRPPARFGGTSLGMGAAMRRSPHAHPHRKGRR